MATLILDRVSRTPPPRSGARLGSKVQALGRLALGVLCLAVASWALLEALFLVDHLRWKYVRWGLVLDEQNNYAQILHFLHGRWELYTWPGESYPGIAVFPGFHALTASIASVSGWMSRRAIRLQCFGISLAYAAVAYAIARRT